MNVATGFKIATDRDNLLEHVLHVSGDGDFLYGMLNLAILDPEPRRTPGIVPVTMFKPCPISSVTSSPRPMRRISAA